MQAGALEVRGVPGIITLTPHHALVSILSLGGPDIGNILSSSAVEWTGVRPQTVPRVRIDTGL